MSAESEQLKSLSKAFFGNRHQLEVACAIANEESGIFTATTISVATGVPRNLVGPILAKLESVGTVTAAPRVEGSASKFFSRNDSDFWSACLSIMKSLSSEPEQKQASKIVA